ncbi:hypothetical protein KFK09_027619 [Dendrobium nobile]|uniref:DUF4378 domain-containing protein n=1 Tax=Dendrobium nobile TaxID=94219 RepID=A0A8T3AC22_DENNO|nr:hypothetical protein KFK09_027619 [Dendrobium nobile]
MPSSFPWNPAPHGGRSLAKLLEEQQEPFLLEVYLMENGCSGRMIASQSKPFCWPLNLCKRLRIRQTRQGGTTAIFLKRTLTRFIYSKTATIEHRRLSFSSCFSEESKHQLSPVSILELYSADSSPFHNHIKHECRSTSSMDAGLNKVNITFEVIHQNSKSHNYAEKRNKFSKRRIRIRPALDCVRKAKEKMWSSYGIQSSADLIKKAMNELILSWERQKGDVNNLVSDFSSWKEWNQFKPPQVREIGFIIEAAIFDDLSEELVLDMLALQ